MSDKETPRKEGIENKIIQVDRSEALITPDHPHADLFHKIFLAAWTQSASPDPDGWK